RPLDLGKPEGGGGRSDDEIAGQGYLRAARQRGAVDGRDEGLDPLTRGDACKTTPLRVKCVEASGGDHLQICAGAEDRWNTGQHPHPKGGVAPEAVDRFFDALCALGVDGVAGLRTIDRDRRYVPLGGVLDA